MGLLHPMAYYFLCRGHGTVVSKIKERFRRQDLATLLESLELSGPRTSTNVTVSYYCRCGCSPVRTHLAGQVRGGDA